MIEAPQWFAALGDRFRLERVLGRGGMATVYLAEELHHRRLVAIKILDEFVAAAVGSGRFLREIAVVAQLNHPNILPLLDSGTIPPTSGGAERPYFVMPYVAGDSLKQRLSAGPLDLDEALAIVRAVAGALDHAHRHRIIHRDIKPGNILLSGESAVVADFGIARALDRTDADDAITSTGLVLGTPQYMAPEQAESGAPIDARTDVYSLGCVVHEMLTGTVAFPGHDARQVLAQHRLNAPPSLRASLPTLAPGVAAVVERAMAREPSRRFPSAGDFSRALDQAAQRADTGWHLLAAARRGGRAWAWRGGVGLVLAVVIVGAALRERRHGGNEAADTSSYAILPFESARPADSLPQGSELLRDAFASWEGITVTDGFRLRDQLARRGTPVARTADEAARVALDAGAGRHVRTSISRVGDSLLVRATLYNSVQRLPLATASVPVDVGYRRLLPALGALADSLLVRDIATPAALGAGTGDGPVFGTHSLRALRAFWSGQQALRQWHLSDADSNFAAALAADRNFAQAALRLALVRSWNGEAGSAWNALAYQADAARSRLLTQDQELATALAQRARDDLASACAQWRESAQRHSGDFVSWYGLADCLASDAAVIPSRASKSGWRFRTSYHDALAAFRHAYLLQPTVLLALNDRYHQAIRRLFKTAPYDMRDGRSSDGRHYWARPEWSGDTLALVPWPESRGVDRERLPRPDSSFGDAILHERRLFYQTVSAWVAALPSSPDALAAQAQAREMLGDPDAIESLTRARALATGVSDRLQLAAAAAWLRLKHALPDDLSEMRRGVTLVDSLLADSATVRPADGATLAALAALTGRLTLAVDLVRRPGAGTEVEASPALARIGPALELRAAAGGPRDSLEQLEAAVEDAITTQLVPDEQGPARMRWLARAATLAYPAYRSPFIDSLTGHGDYFLDAVALLQAGDTTRAMALVDAAARRRQEAGVTYVTVDQLPALASLYASAGRRADAVQVLDATLLHLFGDEAEVLSDPVRAASLGRAMLRRADLAAATGEAAELGRWARALGVLWENADPLMQDELGRIRRLGSFTASAVRTDGPEGRP